MRLHEALREFSRIEARIGDLYERFAADRADVPELADFWRDMAAEERTHAGILEAAAEYFASSPEREPIDHELIAVVRGYLAAISGSTSSLTVTETLAIALDVETLELDAVFAELVRRSGGEFTRISREIDLALSGLAHHEQGLHEMIERHAEDETLLERSRTRRARAPGPPEEDPLVLIDTIIRERVAPPAWPRRSRR